MNIFQAEKFIHLFGQLVSHFSFLSFLPSLPRVIKENDAILFQLDGIICS